VAKPVGVYVNTYGRNNVPHSDGEIAKMVEEIFDLRPAFIEERLNLRKPVYLETAKYGHMGRNPESVSKKFAPPYHAVKTVTVDLFSWEKLDYVEQIRKAFHLK
jgi:S-adenosylmethionine synthetase